ncbi:hypothetical protein O3G_MSEX011476 [Manduca sexta]|uniref:Aldehyde dehydrogenase domain-containing protein n=1 Tax=Manduca sexta TaxID=7130 RepID=A0A921ZKV5_MANSE|nr:hypothetical protein O3G_MSEX011476 [Manduca sexta]
MAPPIKYTKLFIDNEWVDAKSGNTFETFNPHDGSVIAKVSRGGKEDIDSAVSAAKYAFHRNSEWRLFDASKRGQILNKFADLMERDIEYLAELESYNNGMILQMAKGVVSRGLASIRYVASLADKIQEDTIPADGDVFSYTLKQPVGVCGLILPWNAPILMFLNKVCTALAAGCTVVVKPPEQTPLTALVLEALLKEAGIPKGVVNIVTGFGEDAGVALTHHPDVAKISFTGSLEVGKLIQKAAGTNNLKRVTLELGGKSPLVIMNDADCIFTIYNLTKYERRPEIHSLTIDRLDVEEVMMNKVLGYIEKGKQEGAKLQTGGKRVGTTGYYIEPTVFSDVTDDMTIAKEEIFGPVQRILKFDTLEEVVDRANATNYGLAAGIFTSDINTALQYSKLVEAVQCLVRFYFKYNPHVMFIVGPRSKIQTLFSWDC